jgi:hypothetical protein
MTKLSRLLACCAVLAAGCAVFPPLLAAPSDTPSAQAGAPGNVLVTVRIGKIDAGKRTTAKTYQIVVTTEGRPTQLLSGARVPIPTTAREAEGAAGDDKKMTSFVYQNIGFSITASVAAVDKGKIKLQATLEDSRVKEGDPGRPPTVETRQLVVDTVLQDGIPLEVTRVDLGDEAAFVEVEARLLR